MGDGQDWICFDVEKEYGGEEDEVLWTHRTEERYGEKTDVRKDGRQVAKGQTCKDLVPGFERMDQWIWQMHPNWQLIGKDGVN